MRAITVLSADHPPLVSIDNATLLEHNATVFEQICAETSPFPVVIVDSDLPFRRRFFALRVCIIDSRGVGP